MKELSIEEKAKAYDEAIERAKGVIEQNPLMEYLKKGIEYILPELRESKDERIRKAIIATIHLYYGEPLEDEAKEMIAWLEKQSTPQVRTGLEWVNTIEDACDKRYSEEYAHGEYCHKQSFKWGFQEGVDWFEKRGEQKPDTDFSDLRTWKYIVDAVLTEKDGIGQYLDSPFTEEVAKKLQKRFGNIEQILANSAKTCKDEKIIVCIPKFRVGDVIRPKGSTAEYTIESISGECYHGKGWGLHISCDDDYELVEQKLAWSEEDELYIRELESLVKQVWATAEHKNDKDTIHRMSDLSFFLKTLKPQSQWKPSGEQFNVLNEVINFAANHESPHWNDYIFGTLNNLIRQLKKLREK